MTTNYLKTQKKTTGLGKSIAPRNDRTPLARTKVPPREGFVETPDHEALHYQVYGSKGPFIILCDGLGCDGYIWKYLIPAMATSCRVLHWQYRGHGQSSYPKAYETLTIHQMAQDLDCVLETVVQGPAILMGHSLGVQVILEYALLHPSKVLGLVPICGGAGHTLDYFMHSNVLKTIFPYVLWFIRTAPSSIAQFLWNNILAHPHGYYPALLFQLTSSLCSKEDLQPYLDHLARIDSRVFMELAEDMGNHSVLGHLDLVQTPTLVFAGDQDNFTPLWQTQEMAEKIAGSEVCIMPGGTHTAPLELPELIHLRVEKFFRERLGFRINLRKL